MDFLPRCTPPSWNPVQFTKQILSATHSWVKKLPPGIPMHSPCMPSIRIGSFVFLWSGYCPGSHNLVNGYDSWWWRRAEKESSNCWWFSSDQWTQSGYPLQGFPGRKLEGDAGDWNKSSCLCYQEETTQNTAGRDGEEMSPRLGLRGILVTCRAWWRGEGAGGGGCWVLEWIISWRPIMIWRTLEGLSNI